MKNLLVALFLTCLFSACRQENKIIADVKYINSLIADRSSSSAVEANAEDLHFWKSRIDPLTTGLMNETKYASALVTRFNLAGNIDDVKKADSILKKVDETYGHNEAGPLLALSKHAILQHRFMDADSLLTAAKKAGLKPYESCTASFDVDFELGRILMAKEDLLRIKADNDYGYQFRNAKLAHYNGDIASSIASMQKAAELAENNIYLKQAALSNEADLYVHSGDLQKAFELYRRSVQMGGNDLHSILSMGWIAMIYDGNDALAEKIFRYVGTRTESPEPLYRLVHAFQYRGDTVSAQRYARAFELQANQPVYGNMYNKYLIELYTGLLNEPGKAESIAFNELKSRNTPQTNAWYAWALFSNQKKDQAYAVYRNHVSGRPLEGLELYWMGKLMQGLNKGYDALQFFKAASKSKFDLNPAYQKDLSERINSSDQ